MDTREAYNFWAVQYDTNENKTRDLERDALKRSLSQIEFDNCLEIGCGTGKNTEWLITRSKKITSVDLSEKMLAKAKEKITSDKVNFQQADITGEWTFGNEHDLIAFSLVLEHIENLDHIFKETSIALTEGGHIYIGELHPFKQYAGSKARFETEECLQVIPCFNHHVSDFIQSAKKYGFTLVDVDEYFDDDDRSNMPRILTVMLKKGL
jgi:predicted TPR repeat methyltransferase